MSLNPGNLSDHAFRLIILTSRIPGGIRTDLLRHTPNGLKKRMIVRTNYISHLTHLDLTFPSLPPWIMKNSLLYDVSYGVLTQLWAGTSKECGTLNGKVFTYPRGSTDALNGLRYSSIWFLGLELVRLVRTVRLQRLERNCGRGWRSRLSTFNTILSLLARLLCTSRICRLWVWYRSLFTERPKNQERLKGSHVAR